MVLLVYICINAAASSRTLVYNRGKQIIMYRICHTPIQFPYRGFVCRDYESLDAVLTTDLNIGGEFEKIGTSLGSMMDLNGVAKQIPYTLLQIQNAVWALRRRVMFSTMEPESKEDLETHFDTYMQKAMNITRNTARFTGGIEATVDVVLFQFKVAIAELVHIERRTLQQQPLDAGVWAPS